MIKYSFRYETAYRRYIVGISQAYRRHIVGISQAYRKKGKRSGFMGGLI